MPTGEKAGLRNRRKFGLLGGKGQKKGSRHCGFFKVAAPTTLPFPNPAALACASPAACAPGMGLALLSRFKDRERHPDALLGTTGHGQRHQT